jgi:23S rRNA (cytosine1962-C5)-methyltransferase
MTEPLLFDVEISSRATSTIQGGNMWVFSNEVLRRPPGLKPGTLARFMFHGKEIAIGYANPHSLILGRVLSQSPIDNIGEFIERALTEAFSRRKPYEVDEARRLVHSESDGLPGLIVDAYSDHLVLQSNTAGMDSLLDDVIAGIETAYQNAFAREPLAIYVRADSGVRTLEGIPNYQRIVKGEEADLKSVRFQEDGVWFTADLLGGQKTGFFLDQRSNRLHLKKRLKQQPVRVLDLCCYAGAWGLHALKAGAEHVTFVDESQAALALVDANLKKNKLPAKKAALIESDVFKFLETSTEMFDVIVADPPAFVKSKKMLPQAIKAYEKLNRLAWRRLAVGGTLMSSTCSYHMDRGTFLQTLSEAVGKEQGAAHIVYQGGQSADHPILLAMPETSYLKCVGLKKLK